MLGMREPEIYGHQTLTQVMDELTVIAQKMSINIEHFQSNSEGAIVDRLHQAFEVTDFIIINPAAYTHTSVAIRDAILAINTPFIEVHLSNVHSREEFRQHSFFSDVAVGVICGLGVSGYQYALQAASKWLSDN